MKTIFLCSVRITSLQNKSERPIHAYGTKAGAEKWIDFTLSSQNLNAEYAPLKVSSNENSVTVIDTRSNEETMFFFEPLLLIK